MENSAGIIKLEHLVREIITAGNIPFCKIDSAFEPVAGGEEGRLLPVIHIVSYFDDALRQTSDLLKTEFDLTEVGNTAGNPAEGFTGQKLRYIGTLKDNRASLSEYKSWGNVQFEIQLATVLQAAFLGMISTSGVGNSATLPDEVRRDFFRVGALLETAERELSKIKQQYGNANVVSKPPEKPMTELFAVKVVAPQKQVSVESELPFAAAAVEATSPKEEPAPAEKKPDPAVEAAAQTDTPLVVGSANNMYRSQENGIAATTTPEQHNANDQGYLQLGAAGNGIAGDQVPISYSALREFVRNSRLLKDVDMQIAAHAGARLNEDIDIEGDVERLQFLEIFTLKELQDCIFENKSDMIAFAEKWIGKDNGGTFDSGIGLFYLEYVLVAKKNDPTFAIDYVLKYISDNDYSARYIIPTYNSIKVAEKQGSYATAAVKK